MHLFLFQPVESSNVCLRNHGQFLQFCYGKESRISLWSFKAKYRKRKWGITDTSKKDGEYIIGCSFIFHLPLSILFLVFFTEKGNVMNGLEHWKRTLDQAFNASQFVLT